VYNLRPLVVKLDVEEGPFKLGDTINLSVELVPNGDIEVRQARVDLLCEERYIQTFTYSGSTVGRAGSTSYAVAEHIPHRATNESKETYVHSSVVFLQDSRLERGRTSRYRARLEIQPVPPRHLDDARELQKDANSAWSFKWRLVASANVVRGRDPKTQRTVKVALPSADIASPSDSSPRLINMPGRVHTKASTGPPEPQAPR
jgi:hypothetical protein